MQFEPLIPREAFFTKGAGRHRNRLQSFELALRAAGIQACNLVKVSSIFPEANKDMDQQYLHRQPFLLQ